MTALKFVTSSNQPVDCGLSLRYDGLVLARLTRRWLSVLAVCSVTALVCAGTLLAHRHPSGVIASAVDSCATCTAAKGLRAIVVEPNLILDSCWQVKEAKAEEPAFEPRFAPAVPLGRAPPHSVTTPAI